MSNPFSTSKDSQPAEMTVFPPCGPVTGTVRHDIAAFKGIPYALPPVGSRRFAPPLPHPVWDTPRPCHEFGPKCLQFGGILADLPAMYHTEGKSEDCLYLNIYAPVVPEGEKLPVYVYVHGGGFATGSGSELMFDGTNMARRGVIVVTFNYRLGAFGFLALNSLAAEQGTTGNYGLLDQIQALKWVRDNIAAFGGNPDNITLGGESAGAFSVTGLLLSPLSRGLYRRAVIESGSILAIGAFCPTKGNYQKSLAMGEAFMQQFGLSDTPEDLEKLRQVPAEALAALSMVKADRSLPLRFNFWPVYDGTVLPDDPAAALREGRFNAVPLLIGYNTNESSLFIKNNANLGAYQAMVYQTFGYDQAPCIFERYPVTDNASAEAQMERLFNYIGFTLGMRLFADAYAQAGQEVFFYNFNYDPAILKIVGLDTAHSLELPFVFGNAVSLFKMSRIPILSEQMQTHWTNFMKSSDPNMGAVYKNMLYWPRYTRDCRQMMVFDKTLSNAEMPHAEDMDLIEALLFGPTPYYHTI